MSIDTRGQLILVAAFMDRWTTNLNTNYIFDCNQSIHEGYHSYLYRSSKISEVCLSVFNKFL